MPNSFYQALILFVPIAVLLLLGKKYFRPNIRNRVKKEIETRLFAESPTFVTETMTLQKDTGGFYTFRVEGLVAGLTNGSVEIRIVEGTHSGQAFLTWNYQTPADLDLKAEYAQLYAQPPG